MNLTLGAPEAAVLAERAAAIAAAARELSAFAEQDPGLAGACGVEVNALEARTILSGGACARISGRCLEGARTRRQVQVGVSDLEQLERLEGVLSTASGRIGLKVAAMDAADNESGMAQLGSIIGIATGAVGFFRSFW